MSSSSLLLFTGVLLVLTIDHMDTKFSNETIGAVTSDKRTKDNSNLLSTTPESTAVQSNRTDWNTSSEVESDSPTRPPPTSTKALTTSNVTEYYLKNHSQPRTKHPIHTASISISTTKAPQHVKNQGPFYVVILVIAVLVLTGVVVYFCLQKKSRRYSVDLHPKQDEAQIPLSAVEAEVFDTTSEKGLQTLTVEANKPVKDCETVKEAEKPNKGKDMSGAKKENQENLSSPAVTEIPVDKTEEQNERNGTDAEPAMSTKTSMESLDILNETNSDNTQTGG
ncbi:hypothetical protein DNTS_001763 [Danionella cerebrum]|uniref:Uncharacterized protein n=1 Tax=Danionella cerebrum TaxID=2873325 RepID=A0A553MNN8_9TELE|nr:hypothetical protein DNTS_001763 [Danionella translucida]